MAQTRGFVMQIEVGRAALVSITLVADTGSLVTVVIEDLDADPERFNERLSKLGLFRDAMNRAEPVEVEHHQGEGGQVVDSVARITRDALAAPAANLQQIRGLVLSTAVTTVNRGIGDGEQHDTADVLILSEDLGSAQVYVDLQTPEREAAIAQVALFQEAQARGRLVRCLVDPGDKQGRRVVQVTLDSREAEFGDDDAETVDGFVEALSLLRPAIGGAAGTLAVARFTTAPPFTGPGNIVAPTPFTPELLTLLVPKGSLTYDLFEAGLRDNLRMRVSLVRAGRDNDGGGGDNNPDRPRRAFLAADQVEVVGQVVGAVAEQNFALAFAAELLASLAAAARPVWTWIERGSLDQGPETLGCAPDSPSSDLQPQTLRDLRIPYPAVWHGWGCANHGVYRFQIGAGCEFTLTVDGRELCLFDADGDNGNVKIAHACLHGDIDVRIDLEAWTCDQDLLIDVYRLR